MTRRRTQRVRLPRSEFRVVIELPEDKAFTKAIRHQLDRLLRRLASRTGVPTGVPDLLSEMGAALTLSLHGNPERPTLRMESNVMVAYCFRNQYAFEGLHSSGKPLSDGWVKTIMVEACRRAEAWMFVAPVAREVAPDLWDLFVIGYHRFACHDWSQS